MEAKADDGAPEIEAKEEIVSEANGAGEAAVAARPPRTARAMMAGQIDDLMAAVKRLEGFASEEAKRVSGKLLPVETKAKENIWVSLLIALGFGLILGILL